MTLTFLELFDESNSQIFDLSFEFSILLFNLSDILFGFDILIKVIILDLFQMVDHFLIL